MEYKVLTAENEERDEAQRELERQAVEFLNRGWNLHGGVSIAITKHGIFDYYALAQAMVK